ncbi:cyclase family protein [Gudongella sp. SC589]|jgi:kynurenine formamidase|uniref:cyclase family protein n=1 Tax=Gudongella sp. SC589 TaxID=3385990 RepID=UPI003904E037
MAGLIDLSYTIEAGISSYPGDDELKLYKNRFLENDMYNDTKLETGMHVGTHIDVASHIMESDQLISDYPLDRFIGKGILLDVRGQKSICMKESYLDMVKENSIVLLFTGFESLFGSDTYFMDHPVVEEPLADFLVERRVKMIGMDLPSPDHYPFGIHKKLLGNDILIIENLKNLERLLAVDDFEIIALPLKIRAEASLARVVARI